MPNFHDVVISSLKTEDLKIEEELLNESLFFKISPFLAFSAFKRKVFDSFRNNKVFKQIKQAKEDLNPNKLKATALIAKEKIRAKAEVKGSKGDTTTYKLTPEQVEVMSDIYNKYGKELVTEIEHFRVNVLAPYQLIKKLIRKNKALTSKDVTGMDKEEFKSSLESGRKKIYKRGQFFEKSKELENKLRDLEEHIQNLSKEKEKLSSGKELDSGILEKVYAYYNVGENNLAGYSLDELKSTYEEIMRNYKQLEKYNSGKKDVDPVDVLNIVQNQRKLRESGVKKDTDKEEKSDDTKKGSFKVAFNSYMLRRSIRDSFRDSTSTDIYKKTYLGIIDTMISDLREKKNDVMYQFVNLKKTIDFNDKEGKIWKNLPTNLQKYSGKEEDYYQQYKDEDFGEVKYYERPEELKKAEQEIENEIKRFERKLATIVSPEDLGRLKKYRLINNLIVVSELKDPSSLFKTQDELKQDKSQDYAKMNYVNEGTYYKRLKELASMEFDSIEELDNAKKTAKELAQHMRDQGDGDIVQKYADLLRDIVSRRTVEARRVNTQKYETEESYSKSDLEEFAKEIINKKYDSDEDVKRDNTIFNKMLASVKENSSDEDVKELDYIINQVNKKFESTVTRV